MTSLANRLERSKDHHPAGKKLGLGEEFVAKYSKPVWETAEGLEEDFVNKVWAVAETDVAMLLSKHKDYGPKNIANAPGGALNGLRVRMHDKMARINHLLESGAEPTNESLIDSFLDLANYAIIAQLVIRGEWPNE